MQAIPTRPGLPSPAAFREWLTESIRATGIPAARLARRADLSQNAVARILRAGADLYLGSAERLERELRAEAAAQGLALPALAEIPAPAESAAEAGHA
ncbi:hypothetical protein R5H32_15985 [Defluviimonas sp. D31]|uniref:hypothetical protein n=1 Tax=Defluviimonas sp. D31 TaxID=3083253 RepID=UPI00296FB92E|nr:hypothetical protein [Defluviimonas sp. D31]MDW4550862.1 hypothetical protein [Defluviimonas sp. D31]